jgi:hypothetical protein
MFICFSKCVRIPAFIVLVLTIAGSEISAQKVLSGNINQPQTHVKSFVSTPGSVITVDDITGFAIGDTVLMIQMQGVGILTLDGPSWGSYQNKIGEPGLHEFLIIQNITPPDQIAFMNNIIGSYNVNGNVQIIRVPYYNSIKITGKLFTDPWNPVTKKGGVLVMVAGRSITLGSDIDVSGLGLSGGLSSSGLGQCQSLGPTTGSAYPLSFNNSGFKGEGISIHNESGILLSPDAVKGEGPSNTGGGGGNGRYSGGGGGANRGKGGKGGFEEPACAIPAPGSGGKGGLKIYSDLSSRIFFGGGGGGATSLLGNTGKGGGGGGIVILITDTIIAKGGKIIADGGNGNNGAVNGGAGGGGGGGSIALSVMNYDQSSTLVLSAKGGNGGENVSNFGQGGGGGGGLVYSSLPFTANVTRNLDGGHQGNYPDVNEALAGDVGEELVNFKAVLNGFLFNSIRSSVSGTPKDSVCINQVPPKLVGTTPIGGTAPYSYQWQKRNDHTAWGNIAGANMIDYVPASPESDTVLYRRIVTDSSPTPFVDISKEVVIFVQPLIEKNVIGSDKTICYSQNIDPIISLDSLKGGNGFYTYKWEISSDNSTYNLPSENYTGQKFRSAANLTADRWFRRTVVSGRCSDVSTPVKVTVLSVITDNKIINALPQDICEGMVFDLLKGTSPTTPVPLSGGDENFRYKWQSFNGTDWIPASGTNSEADYNPAEITQKLRRVVYSGPLDVCQSISSPVDLRDFPAIGNNIITLPTSSQKICSGVAPGKITGSQPFNGDGTYTYAWQDSTKTHGWTFITDSLRRDFYPPVLTDTTWYRRVVRSSACEDYSNKIKVAVHKPIINTISLLLSGMDTVICAGQDPNPLKGVVGLGGTSIPGDYSYQWLYSTDDASYIPISGENGLNFNPPVLTQTTYYKRQVTSGACSSISEPIKILVLTPITNNNISNNQTICKNTAPRQLTGEALSGGTGSYSFLWQQSTDSGVTWTGAAGLNNDPSGKYSPMALGSPVMYRRLAVSGLNNCCTSVSNSVLIGIYPSLPSGEIVNTADTSICSGSGVNLKIKLTGAAPWKIKYDRNSAFLNEVASSSSMITVSDSPVANLISDTYTYSICSVEDVNGCISPLNIGTKKAIVYKVPSAMAGNDTSVCGNNVTLKSKPSVGSGKWQFPSGITASTDTDPNATFTADSLLFNNGKIISRIYWKESNWQCSSKDSIDVTFYKRVLNINAGRDTTLYSFDNTFHPVNNTPESWENGAWELISGSGIFGNDAISDLSEGLNSYRWTITNGKMQNGVLEEGCSMADVLNVEVRNIEIPEGFSPNNDPFGYNNTFIIKGLDLSNQIAEMKIISSAGTEVFSTSNNEGETWTDWDGKNSKGSDMPEGTYYYLLKIISRNNNSVFKKSGFLILKRY